MLRKFLTIIVLILIQSISFNIIFADEMKLSPNGFSFNKTLNEKDTTTYINFCSPDILPNKFQLIRVIDINNNDITSEIINNNQLLLTITYEGLRRNIPIQTIKIKNKIILNGKPILVKSVSVQILFGNALPYEKINYSPDFNFYADLINSQHLYYIDKIQPSNIIKNIEKLQNNSWFSLETDYIKLYTHNEQITKVNISVILSIYPEWKNRKSENLNMLLKGKPYPIYLSDSDGNLSDDDILYFMGRFPHGDTTYYDYYEGDEAFFLYYSDTDVGKRLSLQGNSLENTKNNSSFKSFRHIQKVRSFADGTSYDIHDEWNSTFIWHRIWSDCTDVSNHFYYDLFLTPNYDEENTEIKIAYQTEYNNKYPFILDFFINNTKISTKNISGKINDTLSIEIPNNQINSGYNKLHLALEFVNQYKEKYDYNNILLKYIEVDAVEIPFAKNGITHVYSDILKDNEELSVNGFHSNTIAIDTINNMIFFPKSITNNHITANAVKEEKPYLSLTINDGKIIKETNGLLIAYLNKQKDTLISKFYENDNYEITSFLDEIKDNVYAITCNITTNLSKTVINKIEEITNQDLTDISSEDVWCIAGHIESKIEIGTNIISILYTENDNNSLFYSSELLLSKNKKYSIFINDTNKIQYPKVIKVEKNNLLSNERQSDVLIITHQDFIEGAHRLADYRRKQLNMSVTVINVEDIYNQYNNGRVSPFAIKNFIKHTYNNWRKPAPKYLILVGDASYDVRGFMPNSVAKNYMPIYGYPYSDYWFTQIDDDQQHDLIIGRIPVKSTTEFDNYIDKLIDFDNTKPAPWQKKFFFLSGGKDTVDTKTFFYDTRNFTRMLSIPPFVGDTISIYRDILKPKNSYAMDIMDHINSGVIWLNFLGHGAPDVFDIDGWNVEYLSNKNKYGILSTMSCNTGAFAIPSNPVARNESYILEKDKGFVGAIGSTFSASVTNSNYLFIDIFTSIRKKEHKLRRIGDILAYGKSRASYSTSTRMLFTLLGDPLVTLPISTQIDVAIDDKFVIIKSDENTTNFIELQDSIKITGTMFNYGYCTENEFDLLAIREYNSLKDTLLIPIEQICFDKVYNFSFAIKKMPGIHKIKIIADPNAILVESNISNNIYKTTIEVFKEGVLALEPFPNWNIKVKNPTIRIINPQAINKEFEYSFQIKDDKNKIIIKSDNDINIEDYYVEWIPTISLKDNHNYVIQVKSIDKSTNSVSDWLTIPVKADYHYETNNVKYCMDDKINFQNTYLKNLIFSNSDKPEIKLNSSLHTYKLKTYAGIKTAPNPYVYMQIDDIIYITGKKLGFLAITVPIADNDAEPKLHYFNTWDFNPDSKDWIKNNASEHLVKFLRDTVTQDDYLFILSSGEAYRLPYYINRYEQFHDTRNIGHIDTLKAEFKKFGAVYFDSLDGDPNINWKWNSWLNAYGLVGRKGLATPYFEKLYYEEQKDTINTSGTFKRYQTNGYFVTSIFGVAQSWENITINADINLAATDFNIQVIGIKEDNSEDILIDVHNKLDIDLTSISAIEYPKIYLKINFIRENMNDINLDTKQVILRSIKCNFEPAADLVILQDKIIFDKSEYLRGEKFNLDFTIMNISPRTDCDNAIINVKIGDKSIADTIINIYKLEIDNTKDLNINKFTDDFQKENLVDIEINQNNSYPELYHFNNTAQSEMRVYEDTIPPVLKLLIDGKKVEEGSFVALQPELEIQLYDNSPLAIKDSNNFIIFINGKHQPYESTVKYQFESFGRGEYLKAKINIIPEKFYYGENANLGANSIRVMAKDANGNFDTLFIRVNVSRNVFISIPETGNAPNPFQDYTNINFELKAPENIGDVKINIYNIYGALIRELNTNLQIGNNSIKWDGKDNRGNSISEGVYIYIISVEGQLWAKPQTGKLIKN